MVPSPTSSSWLLDVGPQIQDGFPDFVHHHPVEASGTEAALDYVRYTGGSYARCRVRRGVLVSVHHISILYYNRYIYKRKFILKKNLELAAKLLRLKNAFNA